MGWGGWTWQGFRETGVRHEQGFGVGWAGRGRGSAVSMAGVGPRVVGRQIFAAAAPGVLAVLRDQVLATFNLQPAQVC